MRKLIILVLAVGMILNSYAQKQLPEDMQIFFSKKGEAYFKIFLNSPKELSTLSRIVSIDQFDGSEVIAYANKDEFTKFLDLGLEYELMTNPGDLINPKMFNGDKSTYEWDTYPTYDAYVAMMYQFATDYPDICQIFSIGTTTQGRELLMAKISDNVSVNEPEAQFLYTGTMHGDETAGFVIFLRLIDYLTSNYGTDPEVTDIVNNLEVWINPAANPDGTYHGGNSTVMGAQRYNANNVDLNRNYADPEDGPHPDGNVYQAETLAFMAMAEENNFVASANTHGGAEVVNYPWDTWPRLSPDDAWWQFVSHEFADTAQYYSPSFYFNGFNDGITNGYAWYTTSGCRQDYMNYFHNCREFTLEISDIKLLPENQLNSYWNYTNRSFINYIKQCYYGVRGLVTDSITGEPLLAKVEVLDHDMDNTFVFTREGQGNYHRLIKAGTYDFKFSAEGYIPKTFTNVEAFDYDSTVLNVQLVSAALVADFTADNTIVSMGSSVQFTQQCFGQPETYSWTFEGGTPASSSEPNPVVVYDQTGSFDVTLTVTKGTDTQTMFKEKYIMVNEEYLMENTEITTCSGLFMDNGGNGDYSPNSDYTMTIFADSENANTVLTVDFIEFVLEANDGCTYDYLKVYDGPDISSTLLGTYCGTNGPGTVESTNPEKALTFVFHSDINTEFSGWKAMINCTTVDAIHEIAHEAIKLYPNPVNNGSLHVQSDSQMEYIKVFSVNGQLMNSFFGVGKNSELDISALESGVYLVEIKTEEGISHRKIVIQ